MSQCLELSRFRDRACIKSSEVEAAQCIANARGHVVVDRFCGRRRHDAKKWGKAQLRSKTMLRYRLAFPSSFPRLHY